MIKPMLAAPVTFNEGFRYRMLEDDELVLEEKLDGHRIMLEIGSDSRTRALNRRGEASQHQSFFSNAVWNSHWYWLKGQVVVIDGEYIPSRGTFYAFDVPYIEDVLSPDDPWYVRHGALNALMKRISVTSKRIVQVPTAQGFEQKAKLVEECLQTKAEGIMVKYMNAKYSPGVRSGAWSKVKFTRTADLVISQLGVEDKNNAVLCYFGHAGELVEVGRCSLNGKPEVSIGDVVEVRYLYVGKGQRLYQPNLLRVRHDKKPPECTEEQLV